MNEKNAFWIIAAALMSVLCLSGYAALKMNESKSGENVIIIADDPNTSSTDATENTSVISTAPDKTEPTEKTAAAAELTEEPSAAKLWININTADAAEFVLLDGIGETIAGAIVEYRSVNGDFRNIEELMNVEGIGEAKFMAIKDYIYVENPVYPEVTVPTETETTDAEEVISEEITEPQEFTISESSLTLEDVAPININTAEAEELMLLPHVTENIAIRIIELREAIGGYSHPYELLYIEELEQNQVAELIEFVTVVQ